MEPARSASSGLPFPPTGLIPWRHREDPRVPSQEHSEKEVKGLYAAIDRMEKIVAKNSTITEKTIQTLHAVIMSEGKTKSTPSPYRDGQNIIREVETGNIVYMPPEAKDVPKLMKNLVQCIKENENTPAPIVAGIAHYQFATIHPYYDGNGRTARLLATMILHMRGYGLKGIYSLEEYYAKDLPAYYRALTIGPSHNYYMGRAEAEITSWVGYFCSGMAQSFEKVQAHAQKASNAQSIDQSPLLRNLDAKQRRVLDLFSLHNTITAKQIGELFGFQPRTARALCLKWKKSGFIIAVDESRKGRKYKLSQKYSTLII